MPRKKADPRVKVYEEKLSNGRTRYRVRVKDAGASKNSVFWRHAEALQFSKQVEQALLRRSSQTIRSLLDAYYAEKVLRGKAKPATCTEQRRCNESFLAEVLDLRIADFTAQRAAAIYDAVRDAPSRKTGKQLEVATHHFYLVLARSFFAWAVRKGYVRANPFQEVRPVGRSNTGKPQLRAGEAERWVQTALQLFDERQESLALAAVMLLTFGLRASEALTRRVRDIDQVRGKWLLWIDEGMGDVSLKNRNSRRHFEIPAFLTSRLQQLIAGRATDEWLFGEGRPGHPRLRQTLWSCVRRICVAASVPIICPHSLRGLNATLGLEAGITPHAVAAALGHGSFAMTAKHYAQPEVIVEARTTRVVDVLDLAQSAESEANSRDHALRLIQTLDAQTLAHLAQLLK